MERVYLRMLNYPQAARLNITEEDMAEFLTVKDAAALLPCSVSAVRKWITAGRLRVVRAGRLVRIRREDLECFLTSSDDSKQS